MLPSKLDRLHLLPKQLNLGVGGLGCFFVPVDDAIFLGLRG
jgi:hypothetical protein